MPPPSASGDAQNNGAERTARKLLKPTRRAQIEVWLGEVVSWRDTQHCAAGRLFGHHSDALAASAVDNRPGDDSSHSISRDDICTVCGRSPEGEEPAAHQAGKEQPQPDGDKLGKGKHVFRGIRTVMGHLRARDGGRSKEEEEEGWDRTVSTQMFLAEASEHGSSLCAALSSSESSAAGGGGGGGGGGNNALNERMARLMRAQKLLDKSQAKR
ncbi:hypothetical protein Daus18300_014105 [Diaporthe australafricana]|uniref:Uncharacterized protein n=1 Tax=Diaporthe australafricana TaxID=127596 RepID=A0ABR3VWJ6_9PEZI